MRPREKPPSHDRFRQSTSSIVRELAAERGVSERTAWRYRALLEQGLRLPNVRRTCQHCGTPLPVDATLRRRYCKDLCRIQAARSADKRQLSIPDARSSTPG